MPWYWRSIWIPQRICKTPAGLIWNFLMFLRKDRHCWQLKVSAYNWSSYNQWWCQGIYDPQCTILSGHLPPGHAWTPPVFFGFVGIYVQLFSHHPAKLDFLTDTMYVASQDLSFCNHLCAAQQDWWDDRTVWCLCGGRWIWLLAICLWGRRG